MAAQNGLKTGVICIGGSAGALEPLQRIVAQLPETLAAPVFVTVHTPAHSVSALPHILSRAGPLFATHAIDGAPFAAGRIYVAPPDCHLVVAHGTMGVVAGAKENGYRPSIDVLFRSAAQAYGRATCGVLLSGALNDGVAGLGSIRAAGGLTMAQDPEEALFGDMPSNAIQSESVDVVRPADRIAQELMRFATAAASLGAQPADVAPDERAHGQPSVFTCPDCGGTLWELDAEGALHFRCRTGHSYNTGSMAALQRENIEKSLYTANRALKERADLLRRVANRAAENGDDRTVMRMERQIEAARDDQLEYRSGVGALIEPALGALA